MQPQAESSDEAVAFEMQDPLTILGQMAVVCCVVIPLCYRYFASISISFHSQEEVQAFLGPETVYVY